MTRARGARDEGSATGATYGLGFVVADGRRSLVRALTNDNQPATSVRSVERREEDEDKKEGENEENAMYVVYVCILDTFQHMRLFNCNCNT